MKKVYNELQIGSIWVSRYDSVNVQIRGVYVEDSDPLICYYDTQDDRTYECSPEEFLRRFVQKETA